MRYLAFLNNKNYKLFHQKPQNIFEPQSAVDGEVKIDLLESKAQFYFIDNFIVTISPF